MFREVISQNCVGIVKVNDEMAHAFESDCPGEPDLYEVEEPDLYEVEEPEYASCVAVSSSKKRLPSGNSKSVMFVLPGKHLRNDYFGPEWRVFRDVEDQGDCFFDCISRAINSVGGNTSIMDLRQQLSQRVTAENYLVRRTDYMANAPYDDVSLAYAGMGAEELKQFVGTPDHYATMIDIRDIYDDANLDVIPIIVNALYGNKSAQRHGQGYATASPVMSYLPSRERHDGQHPAYRRYILLYKRDEHFQLMVRTDKEVSASVRTRHTHAYRAVYRADELPLGILAAFANTLI